MLGASLASDDPDAISLVGDFGEHFAVASQMNNDIADLWPYSGKLEDLIQSRNTAPIAFALAVTPAARPMAGQAMRAVHTADQGNRPSLHPEIERARSEVFHSGGVHFAITQTAVHLAKARTIGRKLQDRFPGSRLLSLLETR
jgi:geranylgeranyl pyrophosphate synthase